MINITPQGKQAEVFALPAKGHLVVLGTAGSGKTTIALLRAYHLANLDNNKVLLVTFNAALVQYMKDICFLYEIFPLTSEYISGIHPFLKRLQADRFQYRNLLLPIHVHLTY